MQDLRTLVVGAKYGDEAAFDQLVCQFQNGAVAYAFSILGDFQQAEDAAQEAFIEAFHCLDSLSEPLAFPGWLRRIVFKRCDRIRRTKQCRTVAMEAVREEPSPHSGPLLLLEEKETARQVQAVIAALPEGEQTMTLLFYFGQHSHAEIAAFLEVSVSTVKKRLFTARKRLKEGIIKMMQEDLSEQRPSRSAAFAARVKLFTPQLSQKINSGQSLVRSLAALAEQEQNEYMRQAIAQIQQNITGDGQTGTTLSEALSKHPGIFSSAYVDAVKQGEINGDLAAVLERLSTN